jgi:hypothetical protein
MRGNGIRVLFQKGSLKMATIYKEGSRRIITIGDGFYRSAAMT